MAERLKPGGIFLLNTPYSADEVWSRLPQEVQATLNQKKARFYVVNAAKIARECSLGARINTVMQMAFFHLTQILPGDSALAELQAAIAKSYSSKGQELVERNWQALALARESLAEVPLQPVNASSPNRPPVVSDAAPDFVKTVTAAMLAGLGDALPVSALPPDGTWPMGTTRWEKRNIAEEIPIWKEALCTQCNHCVAACPHSAIRAKVVAPEEMENAPASLAFAGCEIPRYARAEIRSAGRPGRLHRLQPVRRSVSGERPPEPGDQGHQYDVPPGACGRGEGQLRVLPQPAGNRPQQTGAH